MSASSMQISSSQVPADTLEQLAFQVYPLRIIAPDTDVTAGTYYADHVPRNFQPTGAVIKRAVSGDEDAITVQLRIGAGPDTVFTTAKLIIGEVTAVALGDFTTDVQNDGLAADLRLSAIVTLTPATLFPGYTDSQGLQIDLLGRWTS